MESIIPNLGILREYKPMMKQFWKQGLFDEMDKRYFDLINRSSDLKNIINWNHFDSNKTFEKFRSIFNSKKNVTSGSYFDKMTHFDFKCLLPALLHVEDRMSMAHGLESRVPLIDHKVIELASTIPADIKFKNGNMKYILKSAFKDILPNKITNRRDKMGFPVPLKEWFDEPLKEYLMDNYLSMVDKKRWYLNIDNLKDGIGIEKKFSRKTWALLSLEVWQQQFHDRAQEYKKLIK